MKYVSTDRSEEVDLRRAVESCYAHDGELYMPASLPTLPRAYFNNIEQMSLTEIAYVVMTSLLGTDIDASILKDIVDKTFDFKMPLVHLDGDTWVLELFHGPTMAYKDIGAQFLAAFIDKFSPHGKRMRVVVATTGNTGGAVANALRRAEGTDVIILFPKGTLSRAQQAQLSTGNPNIHLVEVAGTISQCKAMTRQAVTDDSQALTVCANTHNILRILPQVAIFFYAYAQLRGKTGAKADNFTVSIPCGNLSNLTAAVIARRMGLPMGFIVAGCNANDDLARVLDGSLTPDKVNRTARPTLAWAMDSGYPVNLKRIMYLYGNDIAAMRHDIAAASIDDDAIANTIVDTIDNDGYTPDPHTAVALAAAKNKAPVGRPCVVLATAHPAKSLDKMTAVTGRSVELPLQYTRFMDRPVSPVKMAPTYAALARYINTKL